MENDETGQADGVGVEEEELGGKERGPGIGWEERGKEKFLRGTTKYSMTRPVGKTEALSVPKEGERLRSSLRLLSPLPPPFPAKASGWSGPLGAVDTAGGRTTLELREPR